MSKQTAKRQKESAKLPHIFKKGDPWAGIGKEKALRYGLGILFLALFCVLVVALNRPDPNATPTSASLLQYASAEVVKIREETASPDVWTEGRRVGTQRLQVKIHSGPLKGRVMDVTNYINAYSGVDAHVGSRLIVHTVTDDDGNPRISSVYSFDRRAVTGALTLFFAAALVVIGGKKGLKALLGLLFTLVSIWFVLIPLISRGVDPILATVGITALTAAVSLLLLDGVTRKALCALLGCMAGVAVAGIFAVLTGYLAGLNGFNMEEAEGLVLVASDQGLRVSGLLVCGVLISSLGALMDVAMSIASACNELHILNPGLTTRQLFVSGMNIGRDAMGTMANTLILAFAGSSLNMIILFRTYNYPMLQLMNGDLLTLEVLRGLSGSIGIIFTVPLVAGISAYFLSGREKKPHAAKIKANSI